MEIVNQNFAFEFEKLSRSFSQLVELQGPLLLFLDKVLTLHYFYLEIFRRLDSMPSTEMRTIRKYLADYCVIIRFAVIEIQVLRTGKLFRPYDISNNSAEFEHPTVFGSFPFGKEGSTRKLSTRSVNGYLFLRNELQQTIAHAQFVPNHPQILSYRASFVKMDLKWNRIRLSFLNWEMDLYQMFDRVQQLLQTKLCIGYHNFVSYGHYDMNLTPEHWKVYRKYPTLNVPIVRVKFDVEINAELTKYNIENCLISDAVGYDVAFSVLNSVHFKEQVLAHVTDHMKNVSKRSLEAGEARKQDRAKRSNQVWRNMVDCALNKEIDSDENNYW